MKFHKRKLALLETNLDDMNPQWYEPLMDRLFAAGALDVLLIPAIMKKSRPAVILQVLAESRKTEKILGLIFTHTTTLGVRRSVVDRFELKREIRSVKTPVGVVKVKIGRDQTGRRINIFPEFESCRVIAERAGLPLKKVFALAQRTISDEWLGLYERT